MTKRRTFIAILPAAGSLLLAGRAAFAQTPAMVDPKDPTAVALGYVDDTTKADKAKYPKHTPDQKCANCQLYGGAAGSKAGPCPLYQGKQVHANGWCNSWVKKAG